jgi:hypothetical protein
MVERLGMPAIAYKAREKRLALSEDAGPVWVPAPERFRNEIDSLLRLAEVNQRVNPPAS